MKKYSLYALTSVVVMFTTGAFAQNSLAGRWTNERLPQAAGANPATPKQQGTVPNPFDPTGRSRLKRVDDAPSIPTSTLQVTLDLQLTGTSVTGTVTEHGKGAPLAIEDGVISDKVFTFKTNRTRGQTTETVIWKGEVLNSGTVILVPTLFRDQPGQSAGAANNAPGEKAPKVVLLPGAGGPPPDDVKKVGGAIVLHRPK